MRPTSVHRAIALLVVAHCSIDSGPQHYICHALEDAGHDLGLTDEAGELVNYVQTTLTADPNYSWGPAVISDCLPLSLKRWDGNYSQLRLAWIDAMIRDLKTTGTLP